MLVLGICDGHDAGACLMEGGTILAAVSEERLSRRKRQTGFPAQAVQYCLAEAGAPPRKVDLVAIAERSGRSMHRLLNRFYCRSNPNLPMDRRGNLFSMAWQNYFSGNSALCRLETALSVRILSSRLAKLGFAAPIELVDHHQAHAFSAARGSGFAEALVVTMDAFGDGCSGTVSHWRDATLTPLQNIPYPHSPALLYGLVVAFLGFSEGEEGQVSALAATGDGRGTLSIFDAFFASEGQSPRMKRFPTRRQLRNALQGHRPADLAAGLQQCVEGQVRRLLHSWVQRRGTRNLCLAGGLFANVKLNQAVAEACGCDDVFVFPHMGDGGLCVGAAWARCSHSGDGEAFNAFAGPLPEFLSEEQASLKGLRAHPLDPSTLVRIAGTLAAGGLVGIASGRLEFGPRALGNRSILFSAQSLDLARNLGRALKRPEIMPFAPVVRESDLARVTGAPPWACFHHMTATATALPGVARRFPVAVHADGTMRIQVVNAADAPLLHRILTAYQRHVDPPLLINTSFNLHNEPILATGERALALFRQIPLDGLIAADRYWVRSS